MIKLKMWAKFRASETKEEGKKSRDASRILNVNEEYLCALRTKSYSDFFTKARLVLIHNPSSPPDHSHHIFSETLLQPGQETITAVLESATTSFSMKPDLKALILDYFDISAGASKICSRLLQSIAGIQSDYEFVRRVIDALDDDDDDEFWSSERFGSVVSELRSFAVLNNPFSELSGKYFRLIRDEYSSVLHRLKCKRRKVARKMKLIDSFNKASGICVTAACGLVATAAIVLAAHTLTALVMGPAILSLPIKPLKKKLVNLRFLGTGFLGKIREQLDAAAKGTFILNRDFDTLSRLVARVHDEIEHKKAMVELCLEKSKEDYKFFLQAMREMKKRDGEFRKQVEELEEHVYLCLVTINRARALVIKEISRSL